MEECPQCELTAKAAGRVSYGQMLEIAGLRALALELHKPQCEGHVVLTCEDWIRERTWELSQQFEKEWSQL
jgi:hypothetical protein